MSLIRSYCPIWSPPDLVGHVMDDSFYLYTLQNTLPYLPQPIYSDSNGTFRSDPVQFLANGSLPVDLYFDDTLVYRLEIRKNDGTMPPSQNDALIYLVENYIPGTGAQPVPGTALSITDNQITNPQFATVNFDPLQTMIISTAGTFEIAPGWSVTTSGAGTLTVTQPTYTGDGYTSTNQTNASYGIGLANNGFGSVTLTQRFNHNGALWTGEAVCGNMTASSLNPTTLTMSLRYSDVHSQVILFPTLTTANTDYSATSPLAVSTSNLQPEDAWTELALSFSTNTTVFITSVQLIGESTELEIAYLQTTLERQIDHEFHYYQPSINYKPISSYLVGWDFPLNPAQLPWTTNYGTVAPQAVGTNSSYYAWDQTIIFQTADSAITVSKSDIPGIQIEASVATTQMALIQYLEDSKAQEIILDSFINGLSVNVRGLSTVAQTLTISLWRTDDPLPDLTANDSLVTGLDANGYPTVAAGWTEIARGNLGKARFDTTTSVADYGFSGWETALVTDSQTVAYFAIVVGTNAILSTNKLNIVSISLVPGNIPTIPATQTADEVLQECGRYYLKSFATTVSPEAGTGFGNSAASLQGAGANVMNSLGPIIRFPVEMRIEPSVFIYNPITPGSTQIRNSPLDADWTASTADINIGTKGFTTFGTTPGGSASNQGAYVHWVANAQLGIV